MVTRREFLQGSAGVASTATVTLLLTRLIGCGTTDYGGGTATSTGTTLPSCDGVASTSTVTLGHNHEVCVAASDLTSPPAAGMTYTTTPASTDGHTHSVSLSQAQLQAIQAGQSVMVLTSSTESHTHSFAIVRMATTTPAQPVVGGGSGYGY